MVKEDPPPKKKNTFLLETYIQKCSAVTHLSVRLSFQAASEVCQIAHFTVGEIWIAEAW